MSSKILCIFMRFSVFFMFSCGLVTCGYFLPSMAGGGSIVNMDSMNPELWNHNFPWLVFLWLTSIPYFAILIFAWKVSSAVKTEEVFTFKTAKWIKASAILIFSDAGFFFIGNAAFAILKMSEPWIVMISMCVTMFGMALAVLAAILSRYVTKAAALQEEVNGII